jgi:hypothetical protein
MTLKINCAVPDILYLSLPSINRRLNMARRDPAVDDQAPTASTLTTYDRDHLTIYLRLLDADAEGADWKEVAQIVLGIDPEKDPTRAHTAWESHLRRAKWMTTNGYEDLLRRG